jgi:hypothetical protein
MNLRLLLLVLCLGGNVLLATVLFRHGPAAASPENSSAKNSQTATVQPAEVETSIVADTPARDLAALEFHWAQITAPDFALYLNQLREFGAPEPRVREIIMGAVDAVYRPQRAALRPTAKKPEETKFWARRSFYSYNQGTKEQRTQLRALQKEETDLIKLLFGPDVYEQMAKDSGAPGADWAERQYGFIPKELREKVQELEQQMNEAQQDIYAENDNNMDQYAQADLKKAQKKCHNELAKILTPEQLMGWDLRHSDTANQLKNELSAFDPNEDEFRQLFKYKQAMDEVNPPRDPDADPVTLTAEQRTAQRDQQKALDAELMRTLGADRVKEYKLEQDYGYRNLIDSGVPKESVFKLDDMKKQAQDAANKIRRDKILTSEQRNAALAAIRTETQASMNGLLGDKAAKRYTSNGGYWLNNIAPTPAP